MEQFLMYKRTYFFIMLVFICPQAVLLSPRQGGVGVGAAAAGAPDQRGHRRGSLPRQQGAGSGDGGPARSGLT